MTLRARKRRLFFGGGVSRIGGSGNQDDTLCNDEFNNKHGVVGSSNSGVFLGLPLFRQLISHQNPVTSMMIRTTGKPLLLLLLCIIPFGWFVATQESGVDGGIGSGKRIKIVDYCQQHHQQQQHPIKEPIWEWHYYSNQTTTTTTASASATTKHSSTSSSKRSIFQQESRQKRLLIAQYTGHGRLLKVAYKINQQYAKLWKHDYVLIEGNILHDTWKNQAIQKPNCELPTSFSHWNKLALLLLLQQQQMTTTTTTTTIEGKSSSSSSSNIYDQILILDETSMLYDIERDVTTLLSSPADMVAATRVYRKRRLFGIFIGLSRSIRTWEFNIMLWNLHHPNTKDVIQKWRNEAMKQIDWIVDDGDGDNGGYSYDDQWILHDILTNNNNDGKYSYKSTIKTLEIGFTDKGDRPMIQHFNKYPIDYEGNWNVIDKAIGEVCQRHANNPTINCDNICTSNVPRRHAEYEWIINDDHDHNNNSSKTGTTAKFIKNGNDRRKLLIAQYSAYGSYARLLELTAPINKAYAKLYNADYVILQGSSISIYPRDYWCNPPQERSRFNKISLLQLALAKRDEYDLLLLLDADAMIYDFSKDIRSYLPPSKNNNDDNDKRSSSNDDIMLVAHRVNSNDDIHSWDINNGVTLWNLHSKMTGEVVDDWYYRTLYELNRNPTTRRYMLTGDQSVLQAVLRDNNRKQYVMTYVDEFQYRNGIVVKHFIRENLLWDKHDVWKMTSLESRSANIQNATNYVCKKYYPACEGIEDIPYTQL